MDPALHWVGTRGFCFQHCIAPSTVLPKPENTLSHQADKPPAPALPSTAPARTHLTPGTCLHLSTHLGLHQCPCTGQRHPEPLHRCESMVKMPILEFRIKRLDAWHKSPFKCFNPVTRRGCGREPALPALQLGPSRWWDESCHRATPLNQRVPREASSGSR